MTITPSRNLPSVFVSSTIAEFRDLRSAIAYTLRAQGFRVFLSEAADFEVRGDRSAVEECFENIRKCDYFILIIGGKRGNLFKDKISITRQEYKVARDSFLSTGRPRLLLYLRETIELALSRSPSFQEGAGIDYPDHLYSFIDEIQKPDTTDTPNYLTRFRDFETLMTSLEIKMNLGRNLSERLLRHSLLSELLANLTCMVYRKRTSAFVLHGAIRKTRNEVIISREQITENISINADQVISLAFALVGRTTADNLRTRCIDDTINHGVFLKFDPSDNSLQESKLHKTLKQLVGDIRRLHEIDSAKVYGKWDENILQAITVRWGGRPNSLSLRVFELLQSFAYFDVMENIYNAHVAICQHLLGLSNELPTFQRQPNTPVAGEEQKIQSEQVLPIEIAHLIQNNIWPFGTRIPRDIYGQDRETQITSLVANWRKAFTDIGMHDKQLEDILAKAAESYLEEQTASPEEGIENRDD